jgi:pimeloyl-ACP methyl ester carboxylesterase
MGSVFYTDSGKGFPVVFIHGFCESHELWNDFIEPFTKHFRVLTIDLPGFGKSLLPESDFSIDTVGRIVIDWLDELKIASALLIGHSLGGYVILSVGAQKPSLLSGFGLFHSTALADTEEKKTNRNKVIDFVKKNGVSPYIETYVPGLFANKEHAAITKFREIGNQTNSHTLIAYARAMRDRPDRTDVLKGFKKPAILLAGVKDSIIPAKSLEEQASYLSTPTFCSLANSAHMGMVEEKEIAALALLKFISTTFDASNS